MAPPVLVAAISIIGVGVIQADSINGVPLFGDGRVNNWQIDEPVAVYCIFDTSTLPGVFQSIDVWGLTGDKLLSVPAAQIDAAAAGTVLQTNFSYSLTKVATDTFEVAAPNGYTFTWARGAQGC